MATEQMEAWAKERYAEQQARKAAGISPAQHFANKLKSWYKKCQEEGQEAHYDLNNYDLYDLDEKITSLIAKQFSERFSEVTLHGEVDGQYLVFKPNYEEILKNIDWSL